MCLVLVYDWVIIFVLVPSTCGQGFMHCVLRSLKLSDLVRRAEHEVQTYHSIVAGSWKVELS